MSYRDCMVLHRSWFPNWVETKRSTEARRGQMPRGVPARRPTTWTRRGPWPHVRRIAESRNHGIIAFDLRTCGRHHRANALGRVARRGIAVCRARRRLSTVSPYADHAGHRHLQPGGGSLWRRGAKPRRHRHSGHLAANLCVGDRPVAVEAAESPHGRTHSDGHSRGIAACPRVPQSSGANSGERTVFHRQQPGGL